MRRYDDKHLRTYSVMVITLDFESNNPSSNLGMSSFYFSHPIPHKHKT